MLKWFSGDESAPAQGAQAPHEGSSSQSLAEVTEQLVQTQQLVAQLKELIREKDGILQSKDEQLMAEKDSCEAKLSKMKLQNRAKVMSLNSQLEELKKQLSLSRGEEIKSAVKQVGAEGDPEHVAATRGKILLLKKKVEELELQISQKDAKLVVKTKELDAQLQRGMEMDTMLVERDKKLAEKEAYIVHLQTSMGGENSARDHTETAVEEKPIEQSSSLQELQLLVKSLTKKVGESEEKCSLLQEQTESLKELLLNEKAQYEEKENMYKQNIQTFKDIILQKDDKLAKVNRIHEQELFKLAAKSDASADLEQLLKALKQKLHEKEEVLLGKAQVIDVLQLEVDGRDQQIKDIMEKVRHLQSEKDNMQSKLDAEKHVMRAQLRDLMQKHESEQRRLIEKHETELSEKEQLYRKQLEELQRNPTSPQTSLTIEASSVINREATQKVADLEAQVKLKSEEASKSEARFLQMKALSKSRIRQLEDELRKAQSGGTHLDVHALQSRISDLEVEREEMLCKLEQYDELKATNDKLMSKLETYEEQQRKMQADLEQVTKRAASQTSESGSADELQNQVLEWQEMLIEAEVARDQAREEKAAMLLRISHVEEEREALVSRQQELEEELTQVRGLHPQRAKKLGATAAHSLQVDFEFDGKPSYPDPQTTLDGSTPTEGENMGGWWPECTTPDSGLRSVVEELELERNQLQEQILCLEERCQNLEDRLQLQARIESLQTETERLQAQLGSLRTQHSRDAEKHQLLVTSLNEQLKSLSETQECLEMSLIEKEQTIAKTSEKLELIDSLRGSLMEKETQHKEVSEKLLQTEHNLSEVTKKGSIYEKESCDLKKSVSDLTQKLGALKEKTLKQEATIESLQSDLDQTNEELDKLNATHLEERALLIHDLQNCEREIDSLKEMISEKEKEISVLSSNMTEYGEQIIELKQEIKHKGEDLVNVEKALTKAQSEAQIFKDHQSSDQHALNSKITELTEHLEASESAMKATKEHMELKDKELTNLTNQVQEDKDTIKSLKVEIHKLALNHRNNLVEYESQISSLQEQLKVSSQKLQESESLVSHMKEVCSSNQELKNVLEDKEQIYEKELKSVKEERNQLLADAAKSKGDIQTLSKQLEQQLNSHEQVKNEMKKKVDELCSLQQRLKFIEGESECERIKLNQQNKKLEQELKEKCDALSKLEVELKNLESDRHHLEISFQNKEREFEGQCKVVADLREYNDMTQSDVSVIKQENKKLEERIANLEKVRSDLADELQNHQMKKSEYEFHLGENQVIIAELLKRKEELTVTVEELNNVLEQNSTLLSQRLLEKTNECSHLTKVLGETNECVTQLREHVSLMKNQEEYLMSLLREKETSLNLKLKEKDELLQQRTTELSAWQNKVLQKNELCAQLQSSVDTFSNTCSELSQNLEEVKVALTRKTDECQTYRDDLVKKSESITLLREDLAEMGRKIEIMHSANADMKHALDNQIASNHILQEQLIVSQSEMGRFQIKIQTLNIENQQLHASAKNTEKQLNDYEKLVEDLNEKNSLILEQNSVNQKNIEILLKVKEELTIKTKEICEIIEQKKTLSESLLEKANKCSYLTKLLSETEEKAAQLHNQVCVLNTQIEDLNSCISEKEKIILGQNTQNKLLESQVWQVQETLSLLQEQSAVLKTGVMEKESLLEQKTAETRQQVELNAQLQKELTTALNKLKEDLVQRESAVIELNNSMTILYEDNSHLKQELQTSVSTLSTKMEEIVSLQSNLSNRSKEVVMLNEKITILQSDYELLHMSLQENTELRSNQEILIKQLQDEISVKVNQKTELITELQSHIQKKQESLLNFEQLLLEKESQLKQNMDDYVNLKSHCLELEDSTFHFRSQLEALSLESSELKLVLKEKEQALVELQSISTRNCESLHMNLKTKDAQSESLKKQVSTLQDSLSQLEDTVSAKSSEIADFRGRFEKKEGELLNLVKVIQDLQTKQEEAVLFKKQNTEIVIELQHQQAKLSTHCKSLNELLEEKQSAFLNLQEKHASHLEELNGTKRMLVQKEEEVCNLSKEHIHCNSAVKEAEGAVDALRSEIVFLREELQHTQISLADVSRQKEDTLAASQTNANAFTTEIDSLKAQHMQVVAQINALTENLEQRELALHAISNQYSSQVKHAEHLVLEIQKLEEQNKKLREETDQVKQELQKRLEAAYIENSHLQEDVKQKTVEKQHLDLSYSQMKENLKQEMEHQRLLHQQQICSMNETMEKVMTEKEHLQVQVSELKLEHSKMIQTLQESEREWLSVLDRETQGNNLLAEQLKSVENEVKSKDVKLKAVQFDLDTLQGKFVEIMTAHKASSEQLKEKDFEIIELSGQMSANRNQLQEIISSFAQKESENFELIQVIKAKEIELCDLQSSKQSSDNNFKDFSESMSSRLMSLEEEKFALLNKIKRLKSNQETEVSALKKQVQDLLLTLEQKRREPMEKVGNEQEHLLCLSEEQIEVPFVQENLEDVSANQSILLKEIQIKEDAIGGLNIQLSQQKELLASLSNQLKEKDVSVTQVIVSASNEMLRHTEENNQFVLQLEILQNKYSSSLKELENISSKLEQSNAEMLTFHGQLEAKDSEYKDLLKKKEDIQMDYDKVLKEKDTMKKKFQAALLVRKDLLKKVEQYENQLKEKECTAFVVSDLKELTCQSQIVANNCESRNLLLKQQVEQKEGEINNLACYISVKDVLLGELKDKMECLQAKFDQQGTELNKACESLKEQTGTINQLTANIKENEEIFASQRCNLIKQIDHLKEELIRQEESFRSESAHSSTILELEKVKKEKVILQKKVHAALLARKETLKKSQESEAKLVKELFDVKEEFSGLSEMLNMSQENEAKMVKELHYLKQELRELSEQLSKRTQDQNLIQIKDEKKFQQLENLQDSVCSLQEELDTARHAVTEKEKMLFEIKSLNDSKHEVEDSLGNLRSKVVDLIFEADKKDSLLKNLEENYKTLILQCEATESKLENSLSLWQKNEKIQTQQEVIDSAEKKHTDLQHNFQAAEAQKYGEIDHFKMTVESLEKEKSKAFIVMANYESDMMVLESEVNESENMKCDLLQKIHLLEENVEVDCKKKEQSLKGYVKDLETSLRQRDKAFVSSQAVLAEREHHIVSLEQQLQKEIHFHEVAMEQMRSMVSEKQQKSKANEVGIETKSSEQITRKLQAALISRKEVLKENKVLKEEIKTLRSENEKFSNSTYTIEEAFVQLRQHKDCLESSIVCASEENEQLISKVDQLLTDNHNLSAACESLKLTIESITQQKEAFSCQLESLKDSQTVELSEWKSKHTELKQEYDSLLQAYEKISNEMDKMRQALDVDQKEKQDMVFKLLHSESDKATLEKQMEVIREESVNTKNNMNKLEEENKKLKVELLKCDTKQSSIDEFIEKNGKLEAEIDTLKMSLEGLMVKVREFENDNNRLVDELKVTYVLKENLQREFSANNENQELKLKNALNANGVLTATIEAQKSQIAHKDDMMTLVHEENMHLSVEINQLRNDHCVILNEKESNLEKLQVVIKKSIKDMDILNESLRILEDDKSLLQEELENVQEASEKVKKENEYLETVLLKNTEMIDELTEQVNILQAQNENLSVQLSDGKDEKARLCQEKELQQTKICKQFEEKLKVIQRSSEGSNNMNKELQELLKEKHQLINQLQHDCIQYQELILNLERSLKTSQSDSEMQHKKLEEKTKHISSLEKSSKDLEVDLLSTKKQLSEATKEITSINCRNVELNEEIARKDREFKLQIMENEKTLQHISQQHKTQYREKLVDLQNQINELQNLKEKHNDLVADLRIQIESQNLEMNKLRYEAQTNVTKLAAVAADPESSDIVNHWENKYQKTLQEKDQQLLEMNDSVISLQEEIQNKDKIFNEFKATCSRLECSMSEYSVTTTAQQKQLFLMGASNTELSHKVELLNRKVNDQNIQIEQLEHNKSLLQTQLISNRDLAAEMQSNLTTLESTLLNTESQLLIEKAKHDKLLSDLERQEAIAGQLKSLVQNKDVEINLLLSTKDGRMSEYLLQVQKHHQDEVSRYEEQLISIHRDRENADEVFRVLEINYKALQVKVERGHEEKRKLVKKLETFQESMTMLKTENEHLMSKCRLLESRRNSVFKDKESMEDLEETIESKALKQEIKSLLHQMDDLHSENAMLKAQLIRYREDLNQVLSLKDNQLKELLQKQQVFIQSLTSQKMSIEMQLQNTLLNLQEQEQAKDDVKVENLRLASHVQDLEATVSALKSKEFKANESKVIADLQDVVAAKAAECNGLQQKLFALKMTSDDLKRNLQNLEGETAKKLNNAETEYNQEISTFKREMELLRNERETSENRVAELARDLMKTEQLLSEAKSKSNDIASQNESLGRAMVALQNDRDQLIEDFKILRNQYDNELRETSATRRKTERKLEDAILELDSITKERYVLLKKLSAFEGNDPLSHLTAQIDELCSIISEKDAQLKRLSVEIKAYSSQVTAFSGSMASLQDDRDRLIQELAEHKKVSESKQGTSFPATIPVNNEEISLRMNVGAQRTEKDRLLKVENPKFQNGDITEMRQKYEELQKEFQHLQTYKQKMERDLMTSQTEVAELRKENEQQRLEYQSSLALKNHEIKELERLASSTQIKEVTAQSVYPVKETMALVGKESSSEQIPLLLAERAQLQSDLQRCIQEIYQRDQYYQQLNNKLKQAVEEKVSLSSQLMNVSETLRETQVSLGHQQNRCYQLESQVQAQVGQGYQSQSQGTVMGEVPPGAPQERTSAVVVDLDALSTSEFRNRLLDAEQQLDIAHREVTQLNESLSEERTRREAAEEALGLAEERVESIGVGVSRASASDFSIHLGTDDEREALIIDPSQNVVVRKVKGVVVSCRRWLRGRSLYCSKLLTTRAKSRYLFLAYLLALHVMVFMCLGGAL